MVRPRWGLPNHSVEPVASGFTEYLRSDPQGPPGYIYGPTPQGPYMANRIAPGRQCGAVGHDQLTRWQLRLVPAPTGAETGDPDNVGSLQESPARRCVPGMPKAADAAWSRLPGGYSLVPRRGLARHRNSRRDTLSRYSRRASGDVPDGRQRRRPASTARK